VNDDCANGVCLQTCCEFRFCMKDFCAVNEGATGGGRLFRRGVSGVSGRGATWSSPFGDPGTDD